jgi:hypothetical protein
MANARKVYLVTINNGLEYADQHWDIVGIYSLDNYAKALQDAHQELQKFDEYWYRKAYACIRKVWIDKPLDYTGTLIKKIDLRSLQ